MENPFSHYYNAQSDQELIDAALAGSKAALEALIKKHQHYIYNVAHKMVLSPFDAEDVTQEVLIKMITKLSQFKGESDFRTWLYRITFNHFLTMKKRWLEDYVTTFSNYGNELDQIQDIELSVVEQAETKDFIEDAKIGCMSGMLLCLDREQRIVYVLGEIFGVDHNLGSQLLDMSKDNFRQKLARARRDLYHFMNNKCGLVNRSNPCRCEKKTKSFIQAGWVDKENLKFNTAYLKRVSEVAPQKSDDLNNLTEVKYAELFRNHPFQEKDHSQKLFQNLLTDSKLTKLFNL